MSVNPLVKWSQKDTYIGLIIDVIDPKKESLVVKLTETAVHFEVETKTGKQEFDLDFHKKINPNRYNTKVKDRRIKLVIAKDDECKGEWARLTPSKHRWLKFDVDSVDLTDEETIAARKLEDAKRRLEAEHGPLPDDTKIQQISQMINVDDISRDLDEAEKEMYDMIRNSYLGIYNSVIWLGYFYVFAVSLLRLAIEGKDAVSNNYDTMGWLLRSCQQTVFLELIHAAVGITKNPISTSFMQIAGRAVVLFLVVDGEPELQSSLACYMLVVAWSAIEVVRYPYYISQIFDYYLPKLMWLRYNAWIPLYPIGIACEAYLVYQCIALVGVSGRLTVLLPNRLNFAFDFTTYLHLHLAATVLGGVYLMHHMVVQRTRAMKKLSKYRHMEDIYHKQVDLAKIRKDKESKKTK